MRIILLLTAGLWVTMNTSCSSDQQYNGDSMLNYPDMKLVLNDYLVAYEQLPNTFLKVQIVSGKRDSTYVTASDIDWKEIHKLFERSDFYNKKYDKEYVITVMSDTLNPVMTLLYTSLDPKNFTQKLSIKAETSDNKIKSIYFETRESSFFSSASQKILYVTGKTLQIQESSKKPFSALKNTITQYVFLNT